MRFQVPPKTIIRSIHEHDLGGNMSVNKYTYCTASTEHVSVIIPSTHGMVYLVYLFFNSM